MGGDHDGDWVSWESEDRFALQNDSQRRLSWALGEFVEDGVSTECFDDRGDMVVVAHRNASGEHEGIT